MRGIAWPAEDVTKLRRLWRDKMKTLQQVAQELDYPYRAVVQKAYRLGLGRFKGKSSFIGRRPGGRKSMLRDELAVAVRAKGKIEFNL